MNFSKLVILFFTLGFLALFTTAYADILDEDQGKDDPHTYHLDEEVDLISTIKLQYGRPRIVVKSVFPQLQSISVVDGIDDFNTQVMDMVQSEVTKFTNKVVENADSQRSLPKAKIKNTLYIDYDTSVIKSNDDRIISIRFTIQGFITGVSQPYRYHEVLNYNLNTSRVIDLSDLFRVNSNYLNILANYSSSVLFRHLSDRQLIMNGTAPTPENFKNWNIKPNGLLLTFDNIRPALLGSQTVLVPYSALKKIISPTSPIAGCIKHKRKCARNNLLTGGFIDQAINTRDRIFDPRLSKL